MNTEDVMPASGSRSDGTIPPAADKRRWRWGRCLLVAVVLMLLLIALLPTLLSTAPARRLALRQVNRRIPGRLEVAGWSLGWFSGIELSGVKLSDPSDVPVIEVESIELATGLLRLGAAPKRFGQLTITKPRLNLVIGKDGSNNLLAAVRKPAPAGTSPAPADRGGKAPPIAALPLGVVGSVAVRDGEIRIVVPNMDTPLDIQGLNSDLKIDLAAQTLNLAVRGTLGAMRAPFAFNTAIADLQAGFARMTTDSTITWSNLALDEFAPILRQSGAKLVPGGIGEGNFALQTRGPDQMHAAGAIAVRDLYLVGELLGPDRLDLSSVSVAFDTTRDGRALKIANFAVISPLVNADAAGNLTWAEGRKLPQGELNASWRIQVAKLAAQLPRRLKLHADLQPVSGEFTGQIKLTSTPTATIVSGESRLSDLAATRQGQRLTLDEPLLVHGQASITPEGFSTEGIELTSSFLKLFLQGRPEDFTVLSKIDLAAAKRELEKFAVPGKFDAAGSADLSAQVTTVPNTTQRAFTANLMAKDLALTGFTPQPLKIPEATGQCQGQIVLDQSGKPQSLRQIRGNLLTPIVKAAFFAAQVVPQPGGLPMVDDGQLGATVDVGPAAAFTVALGLAPAELQTSGWLQTSVNFSCADQEITVGKFDCNLTQGYLRLGQRQSGKGDIRIQGEATIKPRTRYLQLHGVQTTTDGLQLGMRELTIPDWSKPLAVAAVDLAGRGDLDGLLALAGDFSSLPAGTAVRGGISFSATLDAPDPNRQEVSADFSARGLTITREQRDLLVNETLALNLAAVLAPRDATANLTSLTLVSAPAGFSVSGSLSDWRGRRHLTASGNLKCDGDRLGPVLVALTGKPIVLGGAFDRPFRITTDLAAPTLSERLRATDANFDLPLARAGYGELIAEQLQLPLTAAAGVATSDFRGKFGGGDFALPVTADARGDQPVISLPANTTMFSGVDLANEVASRLLARFLPLFAGNLKATGKVGLVAQRCVVTMGETPLATTDFAGVLTFAGGRVEAAGLLREGLVLAGLEQLELNLPGQDVGLRIAAGQAIQEPLTLRAGEYQVTAHGSLDLTTRQLDYWLTLPVTPKMCGDRPEIYQLLKDETIRVHIAGDASRPKLAKDTYRDNLTRLLSTAAQRLLKDQGADLLRDLLKPKKKK